MQRQGQASISLREKNKKAYSLNLRVNGVGRLGGKLEGQGGTKIQSGRGSERDRLRARLLSVLTPLQFSGNCTLSNLESIF